MPEPGLICVFPRRTKATPDDRRAFVGEPPLPGMRPPAVGVWFRIQHRIERERRRAAEARIAKARMEMALVRAHLLHFPTRWEAPLKALKCAERALETLKGNAERGMRNAEREAKHGT